MKSITGRVLFFFIVYFSISFLLVCAYVFIKGSPPEILPVFETRYKFNTAFFYYFSIFSALEISGFMVSFSWTFAKEMKDKQATKNNRVKNKHEMLRFLRSVFAMMIFCLVLSVAATEVLRPLMKSNQAAIINASKDFKDFSERAKKHLALGENFEAEVYARQALRIDPSSKEVNDIFLKAEFDRSHAEAFSLRSGSLPPPLKDNEIETNIPVAELIERARKAYNSASFFDAHYYAMLAQNAYNENDIYLDEAKNIAAKAWEKLQVADSSLGGTSEAIYALKRSGYAAIISQDYLQAYYIFRELLAASDSTIDPDINRYLSIAEYNLRKQCFFLDEIYDLQPFESVRNVHFSITRQDGTLLIVGIKGITVIEDSGKYIQYLRGLHIISYDKEKNVEENFYVPYAKLIPENAEKIGPVYERVVKDQKQKTVPYLITNCVHRDDRDVKINPEFYAGKTQERENRNAYALPMPFKDFLQITDAAQGTETMSLISLAGFCSKAKKYGFSFEAYFHALATRLAQPFMFIFMALAAAIVAWQFKISKNQFVHFWWLFSVPFFAVIAYFLLDFCRYVVDLLLMALIGSFGFVAVILCLAIYILLFIVLSLGFVSMKDF
ncbi:MAG: hypothetical protein GX297_05650 [Treponema sp.]|jgi:lipopolysaccharide export LptBFGC system permease protein LptF|nr:hypothetical protein [Treponema sp.]